MTTEPDTLPGAEHGGRGPARRDGSAPPRPPRVGQAGGAQAGGSDVAARALPGARLRHVLTTAALAPVAVTGVVLLSSLVFLGLFVRPVADDYCFTGRVRDDGVWGFVLSFWKYDNGRIGDSLLLAPFYLDAGLGLRVFPALLVGLALLTQGVALRALLPRLGVHVEPGVLWGTTAVLSAVSLSALDNPYQSVLWAPGAMTHSVPPLLATALVAGVLGRPTLSRRAAVGALALGGFLLALVNEVVALGGIAAAGTMLLLQVGVLRRLDGLSLRITGLAAGSTVGLATVLSSPGARRRQGTTGRGERLTLPVLQDVVAQTAELIWSLVTRPAVWGVVLVGLVVAQVADVVVPPPADRRRSVLVLLLPAAVALATCAATVVALRLGYGPNGYRTARAYGTFFFTACLAALAYGLLLGGVLRDAVARRAAARSRPALTAVVAIAAAVDALLLTVPLVGGLAGLGEPVVLRADRWDRDDARVRQDLAAGVAEPQVAALPIGGLSQPFSRPERRDWVRDCVELYYAVPRVVPLSD